MPTRPRSIPLALLTSSAVLLTAFPAVAAGGDTVRPARGTSAADTTASGPGQVSGTVTQGPYASTVAGARVVLTGSGLERTRLTAWDGSYSFADLPVGTYDLAFSDPVGTASFKPAVTTVTLTTEHPAATHDPSLAREWAAHMPWPACSDAHDTQCVVSLTASKPGSETIVGSPSSARVFSSDPVDGEDALSTPIGWSLPGLTDDAATDVVSFNVRNPEPWTTSAPLQHDIRSLNAFLYPPGGFGSPMPEGWTFTVALRGAPAPKVVVGALRDARVSTSADVVTISGGAVRTVNGEIDDPRWHPGPNGVVDPPTGAYDAWYLDLWSVEQFPCLNGAATPMTVMTNSLAKELPFLGQNRQIVFDAAGAHFDFPYDDAVRKVNDSGYYQVALPKTFVEDEACGWGKPVAVAARSARVKMMDADTARGTVDYSAELRGEGDTAEVVVTVDGFHFSAPRIEVESGNPTVGISGAQVLEGDSGTTPASFEVALDRASEQTVTVDFATVLTGSATDADLTPTSGTLTFEPGELRKTVTVEVLGDLAVEDDETFLVRLGAPVNAHVAATDGVGTIVDDDDAPVATEPVVEPVVGPVTGPVTGPVIEPAPTPPTAESPRPTAPPVTRPDLRLGAQTTAPGGAGGAAGSAAAPATPGAPVVLSGKAAPGTRIALRAYSRPGTTYRTVRETTVGTDGTFSFTVRPRTNTRVLVQADGVASTSSVIHVAAAVRLDAPERVGARTYRLAGTFAPGRAGELLSFYRVAAGGREVLVGRTRTDSAGRFAFTRTYGGSGDQAVLVRSADTLANEAGTSRTRRLVLR